MISKTKYEVLLVIPLSCSSEISLKTFTKLESFESELGITPPSFYLFPKGEDNYEKTINHAKLLDINMDNKYVNIYYKEDNENGEYYRTLYLKKKKKTTNTTFATSSL